MKEEFQNNMVFSNSHHIPSFTHEKNDTEAANLSPIKLGQLVKCSHHGTYAINVLEVVGIGACKSEGKDYFWYYLKGMRGNQAVYFHSFGQCYITPVYCSSKAELERIRIKWC